MEKEIIKQAIPQIQALLFVSGEEGISLKEISELLELSITDSRELLIHYGEQLSEDDQSGLFLLQTADRYKLATKPEYAKIIQKYARAPFNQTLTKAVLETLAIIAYRQPITRVEIEDIRGVQVASNLQKLRLHELIETSGRLDQPGRPLLYKTTDYFLDYFGINSLDELPELPEIPEKTEDLFFGDRDEPKLSDVEAGDE